jgi:hypothetical protein
MQKIIKTIWCIFAAMVACQVADCQALAVNSLSGCDNYVHIHGESNINQFRFSYNTPKLFNRAGTHENIVLSIPIREFAASNPMMYADFLELMKEAEHPLIRISFSKKQLVNILESEICPDISITIAGITRTYNMNCSIVECADQLYLRGAEVIRLSDFMLKAPAKLMGLVKVNNEINVDFGFIITFTGSNELSSKF